MAFNVRVSFTGICSFIPNTKPGEYRVKLAVVLPDGRGTVNDDGTVKPPRSSFNNYLRRHLAFISCLARDLVAGNGLSEDVTGLWYLDKYRITFKAQGADNPFLLDLDGLANLEKIIPGYGPDGGHVSKKPSKLAAQVLIEKGKVSWKETKGNWVFPNTISKSDPITGSLSDTVYLDFQDLTSFAIVATPLDGGAPEVWNFTPPNGKSVAITIANLCDTNPLQWPEVADGSITPPDRDFEWYYELVDETKKEALGAKLFGLPLPIPYPIKGDGNGQGMDCLPSRNAALLIQLDDCLPSA
jgi:hypothetical protein